MSTKKIFAIVLAIVFLLAMLIPTALSFVYAAPTDQAALSVRGKASQNTDGTYDVSVTVSVSGGEETDSITGVTVYAGDLVLASDASIASGSGKTFSKTANLSDFQATSTQFMVYVTYTDFNGTSKETYEGSLPIESAEPKFTAKCTVSNTKPAKNEQITLTYVISNTGSVDMLNVKLYDTITGTSDPVKDIGTIAAGASRTVTVNVKVRVSTKSSPYITYSVAGATKKYTMNAADIIVQEPNLSVTLNVDVTSINMGDAVTLTGTINNIGNVAVKSLKVVEENLGEIKLDRTSLGTNKNFTFTKIIKPVATAVYCYTVTCEDEAGNVHTFKSNQIKVTVNMATQNPDEILDLSVTADTVNLQSPGKVTFSITVENKSNKNVTDVILTESSVGEISRIGDLNGARTLRYEVDIRATTTFTFYVTGKLETGEALQGHTDPITVTLVLPTPTVATTPEAALPSVPAQTETPAPTRRNASGVIRVIFYVVLALIALLVIGIIALFVHDSYKAKTAATRLRGRGNIHTYRVEADENAEYEGYRRPAQEETPPRDAGGGNGEDPEKTIYKGR